MGATSAIEVAKEFGLPGLVAATIIGIVACCAKPFFKFLTDDRQNQRKHGVAMDRARKRDEANKAKREQAAKTKQKEASKQKGTTR